MRPIPQPMSSTRPSGRSPPSPVKWRMNSSPTATKSPGPTKLKPPRRHQRLAAPADAVGDVEGAVAQRGAGAGEHAGSIAHSASV